MIIPLDAVGPLVYDQRPWPGTLTIDIKTDATEFAKQLKGLVGKVMVLRSDREARCAYCHTLHTAAIRCESCGAPR